MYIEELAREYQGEIQRSETPHGSTQQERHAFDHLKPADEKNRIDTST